MGPASSKLSPRAGGAVDLRVGADLSASTWDTMAGVRLTHPLLMEGTEPCSINICVVKDCVCQVRR